MNKASAVTATPTPTTRDEPTASGRRPVFDFRRELSSTGRLGLGVAAWVAFLVIWELAARAGLGPRQLFPPPSQVLVALHELIVAQDFLLDVWASITRIVLSFALAAAIALPLGVLMGSFPAAEAFGNALVSPFRYLPAPSFIPLLLMWLGTGESQKIALLCLGVVWFLISLVMDNTKDVRLDLIETAKTLGATRRAILWTVVVRAAAPAILDTLRQMLAVAWTYLVIAEIVAATDGIGAMMMRAKRFVRVDDIMAGILVIGLLGLAFDLLFRALRWWAFPYLRRRG